MSMACESTWQPARPSTPAPTPVPVPVPVPAPASVRRAAGPAVSLRGFRLAVPQACAHPSSSQYAQLQAGAAFCVSLENTTDCEADCDLYLDGVLVGHYRVGAGRTVLVERPTGLAQCFVYQPDGSVRAFDADLPLEPSSVGLVKAVFRPASAATTNSTLVPPEIQRGPAVSVSAPYASADKEPHPFRVQNKAPLSSQHFSFVPLLCSNSADEATLYMRLISAGAF